MDAVKGLTRRLYGYGLVNALQGCLFASAACAAPSYPMQAKQVAPGVYAVIAKTRDLPNPGNRGWNANSAFIVTQAGVLVFDTGSSSAIGESLRQTIATVSDLPVRWVVNSHAHGDHWLGNGAFKDSAKKIFATLQADRIIRADASVWVERFNSMTKGATGTSSIVPPNTLIRQRTEFAPGGRKMVLLPLGQSHSQGDLALWLPEEKVLISGDVVYSDRMPSTFDANMQQWIKRLAELAKLQPRVVIPGHGEVTDVQGIVRLGKLLKAFWRAVAAGYQRGKTDYEMLPQVAHALAPFRAAYPGLDDKVKRDISHVYLQVEAASFENVE